MRRQSLRTDRERSERGAELVRRAGREQAHADDESLLGRMLAQRGQMRAALAQVSIDARDEDD